MPALGSLPDGSIEEAGTHRVADVRALTLEAGLDPVSMVSCWQRTPGRRRGNRLVLPPQCPALDPVHPHWHFEAARI